MSSWPCDPSPEMLNGPYKPKEHLCQCELTGVIEILADDKGCELCDFSTTIRATRENLMLALIFTKNQVEKLNQELKHG